MTKRQPGEQVTGPVLELAAKVKAALDGACTLVKTEYGSFYVGRVELHYYYGGDSEVVGYLMPDEGDGSTLDFYTADRVSEEAE